MAGRSDKKQGRREDRGRVLLVVGVLMGVFASLAGAYFLVDVSIGLGERSQGAAADAGRTPEAFSVSDLVAERDVAVVTGIRIFASVPPGVDQVDLRAVDLVVEAQGTQTRFSWDPGAGEAGYTAQATRDEDGSFSQAQPVMGRGDLVEMHLSFEAIGIPVLVGTDITLLQMDGDTVLDRHTVRIPPASGPGTILPLDLV